MGGDEIKCRYSWCPHDESQLLLVILKFLYLAPPMGQSQQLLDGLTFCAKRMNHMNIMIPLTSPLVPPRGSYLWF